MSAFLDIMLGAAIVWFFIGVLSRSRKERARHVWGELDSSQIVKVLDKKRRKMYR